MKLSIQFDGGAALVAGLRSLAQRPRQGIALKALKAGAEPIRATSASNAPRSADAPHIREHIGVMATRAKTFDADAAIVVGPTTGFAYGLPQEVGTYRHPAHPFMRPGFESQKGVALGAINLVMRGELIRRDVLTSSRAVPQGSSEVFGPDDTPGVVGGPGSGLL